MSKVVLQSLCEFESLHVAWVFFGRMLQCVRLVFNWMSFSCVVRTGGSNFLSQCCLNGRRDARSVHFDREGCLSGRSFHNQLPSMEMVVQFNVPNKPPVVDVSQARTVEHADTHSSLSLHFCRIWMISS